MIKFFDIYSVIFPNVSYKGKMFHYDDFPKIDYYQEFINK